MTATHREASVSTREAHGTISMADVAARAGVSQQTVSRVTHNHRNVKESTRVRVIQAMDELGFRPNFAARSLRSGSYGTVGVCTFDISMAGNLSAFEGVVHAARMRGYATTMIEMGPEQAPYLVARATKALAELPVDGVIINLSILPKDFEDYTPLPGLNTVLMTAHEHPRCTTVDSDQYGCGVMATEYLLARGHREIRFIAGPSYSSHSTFREAGWRDTLAKASLSAQEPMQGDWSADSGYAAGLVLAADSQMTALFAANDQMAAGAIAALRAQGRRVPEDISVIGVDDSLEGIVPKNELTTVAFAMRERGRVMFEHAIAGGKVETIRLPGYIIERSSVSTCRS